MPNQKLVFSEAAGFCTDILCTKMAQALIEFAVGEEFRMSENTLNHKKSK